MYYNVTSYKKKTDRKKKKLFLLYNQKTFQPALCDYFKLSNEFTYKLKIRHQKNHRKVNCILNKSDKSKNFK